MKDFPLLYLHWKLTQKHQNIAYEALSYICDIAFFLLGVRAEECFVQYNLAGYLNDIVSSHTAPTDDFFLVCYLVRSV